MPAQPVRYSVRCHRDGTRCPRGADHALIISPGTEQYPLGYRTKSIPLPCGPGGVRQDHWWTTVQDPERGLLPEGWLLGVDPLILPEPEPDPRPR